MIVFCHLLNDSSGSPKVLHAAIAALADSEHPNRLYIGSDGRGILETSKIDRHYYWYRRSRWRIVTLFTYALSQIHLFWRLFRAKDIPQDAIIYVNTLLPFGAAFWGKLTGRTVLYHLHEVSMSPRILQWFLCAIAKRSADRLIYVSQDHKRRLPIDGIPASVITNPVDGIFFQHAAGAEITCLPPKAFNVLMLSSPRDYKGIPEFFKLARQLENRSDVSFTLVLNASQDQISQYLSSRQAPANVTIHPRTSTPAEYYACANLVVNLSRVDQWVETFGLTITEAMAFGLPVIAPPVGGPAEIMTDQVEGLLVDSRNTQELAEAVIALIDTPDLYQTMSIAARIRAADFMPERFAEQLVHEIKELRSNVVPS